MAPHPLLYAAVDETPQRCGVAALAAANRLFVGTVLERPPATFRGGGHEHNGTASCIGSPRRGAWLGRGAFADLGSAAGLFVSHRKARQKSGMTYRQMAALTWLHLSDWHQKGVDFDRKVVRDALVNDIRARRSIDPRLGDVSFVVFSGDLAHGGKKTEYEAAREHLLDPILAATGVGRERLLIVPGNHDLDRDKLELLPAALANPLGSHDDALKWLTDAERRAHALNPFSQFCAFVKGYTGHASPEYANLQRFKVGGRTVALLGLNSAWMCGRRKNEKGEVDEYGRVVVGEPQIHDALGNMCDDVRIVVLHHPWAWLAEWERQRVMERVQHAAHFVLMGHQHVAEVHVLQGTGGDCVVIPAGASYDRRTPTNPMYANGYNWVHVDLEANSGTVFLRRWSERRNKWIEDRDAPTGPRYDFALPTKQVVSPPPSPAAPVAAPGAPGSPGGQGASALLDGGPAVGCQVEPTIGTATTQQKEGDTGPVPPQPGADTGRSLAVTSEQEGQERRSMLIAWVGILALLLLFLGGIAYLWRYYQLSWSELRFRVDCVQLGCIGVCIFLIVVYFQPKHEGSDESEASQLTTKFFKWWVCLWVSWFFLYVAHVARDHELRNLESLECSPVELMVESPTVRCALNKSDAKHDDEHVLCLPPKGQDARETKCVVLKELKCVPKNSANIKCQLSGGTRENSGIQCGPKDECVLKTEVRRDAHVDDALAAEADPGLRLALALSAINLCRLAQLLSFVMMLRWMTWPTLKKPGARVRDDNWIVVAILVTIAVVFAVIQSQGLAFARWGSDPWLGVLIGVAEGVSMGLFVGRLESTLLSVRWRELIVLYVYASIQPLFATFRFTGGHEAIEVLLKTAACVSKIGLCHVVSRQLVRQKVWTYMRDVGTKPPKPTRT